MWSITKEMINGFLNSWATWCKWEREDCRYMWEVCERKGCKYIRCTREYLYSKIVILIYTLNGTLEFNFHSKKCDFIKRLSFAYNVRKHSSCGEGNSRMFNCMHYWCSPVDSKNLLIRDVQTIFRLRFQGIGVVYPWKAVVPHSFLFSWACTKQQNLYRINQEISH